MAKQLLLLLLPLACVGQDINTPMGLWYHLMPNQALDEPLKSGNHCFDCLLPHPQLHKENLAAWYIDLKARIQRRLQRGNYITEAEQRQLATYGFTETTSLFRLSVEVSQRAAVAEFQERQKSPYGAALQPQTAQQVLADRTYRSLSQKQTVENILKEAAQKADNLQDVHKLIQEALQSMKTEQAQTQFKENIEKASQWFYGAFGEMKTMIDHNQPDLLRAVWLSEAALFDNPYAMSYEAFRAAIQAEAARVRRRVGGQTLTPYQWHAVIFNTLWAGQDGGPACRYDFNDPMGEQDLTKPMVCKLLKTRSGQCHSLPLLYKLVANELGVECWMAYLPNHSLVQIKDSTGTGKVYLELTSSRVLTDNNLLESGYVPVEGIHSGLYARTVEDREVITQCISDLMRINQHKLGNYVWQEKCADYLLSQYPNSLTGLIWKITSLQFRLKLAARPHGFPPLDQLSKYPDLWPLYVDREQYSDKLDGLGYAPYSEQAYKDWLNTLNRYQSIPNN